MPEYLLKRLLLGAFTLLAILLVSYTMLRLAPGDPTRSTMFGENTAGNALNAEKGELAGNASLRQELNLDKPILIGFALWLKQAVKGDFGRSASVDPGRPVTAMILEKLPITLSLNIWAVVFTYLLASPIGVYGALKAGTFFDEASALSVFILYSLPVMWVGLFLQALFCEGGLFPVLPLKGVAAGNLELSIWELQWEALRYRILPILCLTYGGFAGLSRYTRNSMLEVIHADYIRTARAKGVAPFQITWCHAFRNALITLITLFGGILPALISGSVLVEYIFNIPGMGSLSLLAMSSRDYPLQMALFTFTGFLTLCGILFADLLYAAADPRIKLSR